MLCRDRDDRVIQQLKREVIRDYEARKSGGVFYQLGAAGGNVQLKVPLVSQHVMVSF